MPAIRDISWNQQTATSGNTLVLAVPSFVAGDLLIACITSDTYDASGGFTASAQGLGWTLIHQTVNTALQSMYWKIAVVSEPESYSFVSTDTETYNGCIISIQDVNQTNPFGSPAIRSTVNQAAASKFAMPTITTNVANSLILYAFSGSSAGVPSMLEGPVYGLLGADGAAESTSIGWGFKPTTGLTSNAVICSTVATGAGVSTALQIAPPATGATVIPAYCSADSSLYLNPLNGTTAYNGDTAFAATADTNYGTTLGGLTAADATVAAGTDVGINSFHSVARVTSISGSRNLSGAELVFATANRPNVTGKNVLMHLGPSTEGQAQRFSTASSDRGIWFGMRSGTATNYKIWQVYGVEKGTLRHQPVVINSSALNTKATAGTLNPAAVLSFGMWVAGSGVLTTIWDFASLWALDTTTVCGGNASVPVTLQGISKAAAEGKERKSVLLQGSSQLQLLQPLQFGDGGTNPIYLELDASAIEVPNHYNISNLDITYNSIDNVAGLTYFAGSSDTIIHKNSVLSSGNDYHWRIHASSSASAVYDFSGLSLIGAGDVQLRPVTTFSDMVFTNCTTITQNSAVITNCQLNGSFVLSNTPNNISSCHFTSSGTGHSIEITTPGTYTFSGNLFTGYGATGTTNAAIYNNSGGAVTLNISGGGSVPSYRNGTSATTSIVAAASVTLTGLIAGTEVRAYLGTNPATATEIDGIESSTTSFTFSQSVAGQTGYIQIFNVNYQPVFLSITYSGSDVSIPVQQIADRNYQP